MQLTLPFVLLAGLFALPATQAVDYDYRFYASGDCDHTVPANETYPPNNGAA